MSKKTNDSNAPTAKNPTAATTTQTSANNAAKNPAANASKTAGSPTNKNNNKDSVVEKKNPSFSHGPVTSLDLERARKELEKNRIEYKVEQGELFTVDNGDAATRSTAIKLVNGSRRKAG